MIFLYKKENLLPFDINFLKSEKIILYIIDLLYFFIKENLKEKKNQKNFNFQNFEKNEKKIFFQNFEKNDPNFFFEKMENLFENFLKILILLINEKTNIYFFIKKNEKEEIKIIFFFLLFSKILDFLKNSDIEKKSILYFLFLDYFEIFLKSCEKIFFMKFENLKIKIILSFLVSLNLVKFFQKIYKFKNFEFQQIFFEIKKKKKKFLYFKNFFKFFF